MPAILAVEDLSGAGSPDWVRVESSGVAWAARARRLQRCFQPRLAVALGMHSTLLERSTRQRFAGITAY